MLASRCTSQREASTAKYLQALLYQGKINFGPPAEDPLVTSETDTETMLKDSKDATKDVKPKFKVEEADSVDKVDWEAKCSIQIDCITLLRDQISFYKQACDVDRLAPDGVYAKELSLISTPVSWFRSVTPNTTLSPLPKLSTYDGKQEWYP